MTVYTDVIEAGRAALESMPEHREFVSGIAPLNGWNFFRRDKEAVRESGIELANAKGGDMTSVYGTCVAASKDSPVKPGDRALIAYRNVREVWHNNEKVCVIKSEDILAVCEE